MSSQPRAAYIHVPFCAYRCGYCNFTLVAGRDDLIDAYLTALERELRLLESPRPVETLFVGGGTPTYLPPAPLERLLVLVGTWFPTAAGCEFSVEANPAGLDETKINILARHGVTRMSLGAQSFNPDKLRLLQRDHGPRDIGRAVELARARLDAVALDLIFGVPDETPAVWRADLDAALRLTPDHLSTYGLTFERGTAFWSRLLRGELTRLDEEAERSLYAEAIDTLEAAGLEHYEVSNFALPGRRCRHNLAYWAGEEYFAAGPGAARYVAGRREVNHRSTTTWLKRVLAGQSPVAEAEELGREDRARETLVFGLRRMEGVERRQFAAQTGFEIDVLIGDDLRRFVEMGLLADESGWVRLTRQGLFVSDSLWPAFLRR